MLSYALLLALTVPLLGDAAAEVTQLRCGFYLTLDTAALGGALDQ